VSSTVCDGEQVLTLARDASPDLILLDLLLPRLTGLDVLKMLKKDTATPEIHVVMPTGPSSKNAERLQKTVHLVFRQNLHRNSKRALTGC